MSWIALCLALVPRMIRRPALVLDLLRVSWRFRHRHWYRRVPFLPIPDRAYVRWRMYTVYGDPDTVPPALDIDRYAHWAVRS